MGLTLTVDRARDDPVYVQVADQLRRMIASGDLAVGDALPPVRRLASDLGVNLNTVARAYRTLEGEGFLEIRRRAGVRVSAPATDVDEAVRGRLLSELHVAVARLRQAGVDGSEILDVTRRELDGGTPRGGGTRDD